MHRPAIGRPANGNGRGNGHKNGKANGKANGNGHNDSQPVTIDCPAEVELVAQQWEATRLAAKQSYDEADRLEQSLIEAVGVGGSLVLSDGRTLRINNNFLDKTGQPKVKAFTVAGVKLAEVELK